MTLASLFGRTHTQPAADRGCRSHGPAGLRQVAAWAGRQGHAIAEFLRGIADGFRVYRRYQDLTMMSDGELGRLAIARRDIVRHVMLGRGAGCPQPANHPIGPPDRE